MFPKVLCVAFLVLLLAGCATTTRTPKGQTQQLQSQVQELQNRIGSLEEELQNKDQKITYLQSELENAQNTKQKTESISIKQLSVKQIQTALKNAGFYKGPVDGTLGIQTKNAIKAFQKANSLKADGMVGKRTIEELSKYLAK